MAGGLLLVMAACAIFAELGVRAALVIPGDAAATAARIAASPGLFRLGFVGYLVAFLCDIPIAVLFYAMLRRVDATGALTAMAFRLVYAAVVGAALIAYAGAIHLATNPKLVLLCMELFDQGFHLALVFFGVHLVLLGGLLVRSEMLPRGLGGLVSLGGVAYLLDNVSFFVAPAFRASAAPFLAALAMSELVLAAWLVVKGVSRPVQDAPRSCYDTSHVT